MHRGRRGRRHPHPARPRHAARGARRRRLPARHAAAPTKELIAEGILPDVPGLYPHDPTAPDVAAIILTHSHLDHYGLAHHAHPAIPVYGSDGTIAILEVGPRVLPRRELPTDLRRLPTDERCGSGQPLGDGHPRRPCRARLARAARRADGQRLLYTGDLRAHGRTGFRFENLLADKRVRGVDWLLCEGTTLGSRARPTGCAARSSRGEARRAGARRPRQAGRGGRPRARTSIASSPASRRPRRSGRLLVIDPYQAYVLMKLAPLSKNIPQFTWDGVRVSFAPYQVDRLKDAGLMDLARQMADEGRVSSDELAESRAGT